MKHLKFSLLNLFAVMAMASVVACAYSSNPAAGYLMSVLAVSSATNYFSRFKVGNPQMAAGVQAILIGSLWSGFALLICLAVTMGALGGLVGFWFGCALGLVVSFVTVLVFALIPDGRLKHMEVLQSPNFDVPSLKELEYTDTQGF